MADIGWFAVAAGFVGGIALFMYGLSELTGALQRLAGDRLRAVLARLTGTRLAGLATGAVVTAVLQSSTVTTVVAIGFVAAGAMTSRQAIPVVLGANVGTTVTAQVISLDLDAWAFVLVAVGVFGSLRTRRWAEPAQVMLGLGLLFVGMQVMATAVRPLRDAELVSGLATHLDVVVLGVLAGALYSAVIRSSSATAALAITLATEDLVGLEAGVAIVIGANVGTCVTAVLAAAGRSAAARRVAGAHVAINLIGAVVWVGLFDVLTEVAVAMSGSAGVARELANAHTVFNVSIAVLLVPVIGPLAAALERLFPDPPAERVALPPSSALDTGLLATPVLALAAAGIESGRLARRLADSVMPSVETALSGSWDELVALSRSDDDVDQRYRRIVNYLTAVGQSDLDRHQTDRLFALLSIVDDLESLGDVLEINMVTLGRRRLERSIVLEDRAVEQVRGVAALVTALVRVMADAVTDASPDAVAAVRSAKPVVNSQIGRAFVDQAGRLLDADTRDLGPYALERDLLEALRRIYSYTRRIAGTQRSGRAERPDR